jgi:hypothetical protein
MRQKILTQGVAQNRKHTPRILLSSPVRWYNQHHRPRIDIKPHRHSNIANQGFIIFQSKARVAYSELLEIEEMLRIYTFGGLRIERDGQPLRLSTQKARDLLAYLITFRDRPHPRSVLAGTLGPDLPEDKARRLSDILWRVRSSLGDQVIADEERIWFNTEIPHWLDVQEFETKRQNAKSGEHGQATSLTCLGRHTKPRLPPPRRAERLDYTGPAPGYE